MTYRVRLVRRAVRDVEEARDWYERQRAALGDDFGAALDALLSKLVERPFAWPVWPPDPLLRRAHLSRFPYSVLFRVASDVIEIVAVVHQRQRPGAWAERK